MAIARIDELLAPDFVAGLEGLPLEEVRARRDRAQEASDVLSYLRRMVQGRIDLVQAERERRRSGEAADLGEVVEQLKRGEIIADGTRASGFGRLPMSLAPADEDGWITAELDELFPAGRVAELPELAEDELAAIVDALAGLERKVSDQRTLLHQSTNVLQEEIVRRYKTGEATVDGLLRS